jgi:hypothetical protein
MKRHQLQINKWRTKIYMLHFNANHCSFIPDDCAYEHHQILLVSSASISLYYSPLLFSVNYTSIIRRYELRPFLPDSNNDNRLKLLCGMIVIGIISSIFIGWNGSGGILFAIFW